jgi:hypothetical protein
MVLNQKNQRPKHFFVRKNEAGLTAIVAKFFRKTFDLLTSISVIVTGFASDKRFPLVSSCQKEKPTT